MPGRGGCRGSTEHRGNSPARPTRRCPATSAARAILPSRETTARPGLLTHAHAFWTHAAHAARVGAVLRAA
eukprot:10653578-Alexandrium_andersonii.AAC.1